MQQKLKPGWDEQQVRDWYEGVVAEGKKRDYADIISRVTRLPANTHTVKSYAVMSDGNPAFRITVGDVNNGNPNILLTGGVHGYEPSGIEAALAFAKDHAPHLTKEFNFVIYPCISPWAYEYDQRWNPQGEDPNRLFTRIPKAAKAGLHRTFFIDECQSFMDSMEEENVKFLCAIDKHETNDRDKELRLSRAARFDEALAPDHKEIPQGYYLTLSQRESAGENGRQLLFGQSIIDKVGKVSPIAPEATILNGRINYGGVILSPPSDGLMRTYLDNHARLVAVTEVYPDHKDMTPEKNIEAQLASTYGALNYIRQLRP
ncbi:MAG: hypothetical protein WC989_00705 [Micavibrio sp.]